MVTLGAPRGNSACIMAYAYENTAFSVLIILLFGAALYVFVTSTSDEE
ncbi:hypothetical protein BV97_01175 [Novosphingobium resinovorum]|uniref:Uncharacterized protein n=1 Tax=Novosphingobium resinovorum TaxID=158500 RepID=A0A031K5U9_9SPHN|nr:hypothetical protein BV97_01175 [Novosphingobium resinovorum]